MYQHERVRVIYKYALDKIPKENAQELFKNYTIHEKKYGDRAGIENVIISRRKYQYEEVSNRYVFIIFLYAYFSEFVWDV